MGQRACGNVILIGFSATGKSRVGGEVARRLGWDFVDTDDEIVKLSGKTIPRIFAEDGEEHFRALEHRVLKEACQREGVVIAAGGGAIVNPQNRELMLGSGVVICLEAKPETIYQRLLADTEYVPNPVVRPLLAGANPLERIRSLKEARQPFYAISDWTISTDNLTIDEVAGEVVWGLRYARRRFMGLYGEGEASFEVVTASERYPVFFGWGLLDSLGEKMRRVGLCGVANIISDEQVFLLYGNRAVKALEGAGFAVGSMMVPAGEGTKTIETAIKLYDWLVGRHAERNHAIVALGGGMVGDLAGFVAATFLRGVPLVQVPTSLVAMVDAAIGGKVAVNHPKGKNLIGAFYQPCLVLADIQTLTSLPKRELISGWAEVIKHGVILDQEHFEFLEREAEGLLRLDPEITTQAVRWSAALKGKVVAEDEKEETGRRTILNYGHTIAHGLEAATGYEHFLHGEAVAIGMMGAAMISERMGILSLGVVERQRKLLERFGLPTSCTGVDLNEVLKAMELDKKVTGRAVRWVLIKGIGEPLIRDDVGLGEVKDVLEKLVIG